MLEERVPHHQEMSNEGEIDLRHLLGILIDKKMTLLGTTFAGLLLAISYVWLSPAIYQADALIQLEDSSGSDLISKLYDFSQTGKTSATTEISLVTSRAILGKTVSALSLDNLVLEKKLPFLGSLFSQPTNKIRVPVFSVPNNMLGQELTLTLLDEEHYKLQGSGVDLNGVMNKQLQQQGITLLVQTRDAQPGASFILKKISQFSAISNIKKNLRVSESSQGSSMLNLTLLGPNKQVISEILDEITKSYISLNIERNSESASKSLIFLQQQLPKTEAKMEKTEDDLSRYRQDNESIDLSLEARTILDSEVATVTQLDSLTFEEAELSKRYTPVHPLYRALLEKKKTLLVTKSALDSKINNMPSTQQNILRLTRDAKVAQEMHTLLISKQQELEINKASTVGNVHIIDAAETLPYPVKPRKVLLVIAITLLSLIFSTFFVLVKHRLRRVINDSYQLKLMGMKVYSSIPYSTVQAGHKRECTKKHSAKLYSVLALSHPDDPAVEAIRSLRTSLYFRLQEAKNKILMVVGPTSGMGKSFVSCNLAVVFAQSGLRVLLVDCDMRKGYLHDFFLFSQYCGLSELLSGKNTIEECLHKNNTVSGLDFISRGHNPSNPSELLLTSRFTDFCRWATDNYDVVLYDTPPVLAVSDAEIISHYSGTNLMVTRFEVSTPEEVELSLQRFVQEGHTITGVVLNSVHWRAAQYLQHGHREHYRYETKADDI